MAEYPNFYGQMREYPPLQQSGGNLGNPNANTSSSSPIQTAQVQRLSGVQQPHPNSPHGQLLYQTSHSASPQQQQMMVQQQHPTPPPTFQNQQQQQMSENARRETPPNVQPHQGGAYMARQVYQQATPGNQPRFVQVMRGDSGHHGQGPSFGQAQQHQQQVLYRPQAQGYAQAPGQQQVRYAYVQRPATFQDGNRYIQVINPADVSQQGTVGYPGGTQLRQPHPVIIHQQQQAYHHQSGQSVLHHPSNQPAYHIQQPGSGKVAYVGSSPAGGFHPQPSGQMTSEAGTMPANMYYSQPSDQPSFQQHQQPLVYAGSQVEQPAISNTSGSYQAEFSKGPTATKTAKSPSKGAKGKGQPKSAELVTPVTEMDTASDKLLLSRDGLAQLARSVDPTETLEDDVGDTMLSISNDFIDSLISSAAEVSRHRGSKKLEAKDVRYILERRYNMTLPPDPIGANQSAASNISVAKSPTSGKKI